MTHTLVHTPSLPGSLVPALLWGLADLREARPDLTARQAWEVFKLASSEQDARIGITEDLLLYAAEELYGPAGTDNRTDRALRINRGSFRSSLAQRFGGAA